MSGDDTLSRVALSRAAFDRWHTKASELAREPHEWAWLGPRNQ